MADWLLSLTRVATRSALAKRSRLYLGNSLGLLGVGCETLRRLGLAVRLARSLLCTCSFGYPKPILSPRVRICDYFGEILGN